MFENAMFIMSDAVNDGTGRTYAPMFRRRFKIDEPFTEAKLSVCGLGYGYSYLNGKKVTDDMFTAPVSNYTKTLWYNEYDVSSLLKQGENVFAAVCGNGWYNEIITSSWDYDKAPWNDTPKIIMSLCVDGKQILASDAEFKVKTDSPWVYNQLRSGEHFDARLYEEGWNGLSYNDSDWKNAVIDDNPPEGIFRKCECEPIRECAYYPAVSVKQTGEDTYVFDFGQNMSGYVRVDTCLPEGTELVIRYAEQMNADGTRNINEMDHYYKQSEIETDRFVCNGKRFAWSPLFTYHGFNYAVISGITDIEKICVTGVFVHQDVRERADFECSDYMLSRLYRMGKMSSWSNMFYQLTDCPTREKLGWLNDARASAKQMLTNFEIERLFEKWIVDIRDAMKDDGSMPGIAPTWGWGYHWGNGPVSDGILFEIPYQIYVQTGKMDLLTDCLPYFDRYLNYLDTCKDGEGLIAFGLPDWAAPREKTKLPAEFTNAVLEYHFLHIASLAARVSGKDDIYAEKAKKQAELIKRKYIEDGICVYESQTAVAMLIYFDLYESIEPLSKQLMGLIEKDDFHHNCGMVGLRHLYYALDKCGMSDTAFRIITNPTYPSQAYWLKLGANTLWEMWEDRYSRNHHMYSDFMGWCIDTVLGIKADEKNPAYCSIDIAPAFIEKLTYAKGHVNTVSGRIGISWERTAEGIQLTADIPEGITAFFRGERIHSGVNEISVAV